MPRPSLDKAAKTAISNARKLVEENARADGNEAETRKRIDYILEKLLGYDTFKHITQEYAVHGAGDTVHCDLAIQLSHEKQSKPDILIEVKRANIDLGQKHIRQAASYAIDVGCEWMLLTNSNEWRLYHIAFGQPPQTRLIESWNLLNDVFPDLARKFQLVGYKNVKKQGLDKLWERRSVLTPNNMLRAILSEDAIKLYQRRLRKATDVAVSPEDIVRSFRYLLNEAALSEMDNIRISLPAKQKRTTAKKATKSKPASVEQEVEAILSEKQAEE